MGRHFCLLDGRLFKQKSAYGRTYLRLCVPPEYRSLFLKSCHDDPVAGHMGIQRTLTKIIGRFFWNINRRRNDVCQGMSSMLETEKRV